MTLNDSGHLETYLNEISGIPLLKPEEETELGRKARQGEQYAIDKLVEHNLRFVVSVAKQYGNRGLSLADIINEGNLGLVKAARRFDERYGFKFISYAVWWIKQAILTSLADNKSPFRLPANRIGDIRKIKIRAEILEQEYGRHVSSEEAAYDSGLSLSKMSIGRSIEAENNRMLSLDMQLANSNDSNNLLALIPDTNLVSPDQGIYDQSLKDEIDQALNTLTDREATIVYLYFGIDQDKSYTLEEIGTKLGLTRERIRQIKKKAIYKLKHKSRSARLQAFYDLKDSFESVVNTY